MKLTPNYTYNHLFADFLYTPFITVTLDPVIRKWEM